MSETDALRVAVEANTAQAQVLAGLIRTLLEALPAVLVLVVAGIGVQFGHLAGGAVRL